MKNRAKLISVGALIFMTICETACLQKRYPVSSQMTNGSITKDIQFWAHQLEEHAEYLSYMVPDNKKLTQGGVDLKQKFHNFIATTKNISAFNDAQLREYKKLLAALNSYQKSILLAVTIKPGYKAAPSLIKHMQEELTYHSDNLKGKTRTKKEEKEFWTNHDKEVVQLKETLKKVSAQEKEIFDTIMKLGMEKHEQREDRYAESQMK